MCSLIDVLCACVDHVVEKQLFEHHQQILEKHTEELSGFTENIDTTGNMYVAIVLLM